MSCACSLILVLLLASAIPGPPDGILRGRVVDAAGVPIAGARITTVPGAGSPVLADADGRFEARVPPDTDVVLTVEAPGFRSATVRLLAGAPVADVQVSLQPDAVRETVVVTATRGASVGEAAMPVSVLDAETLRSAASPALDDALRQVPGFTLFRRTSSRTANPTAQGASLRGLSASGASRALVLADGAPLNDPFGGWVYWNRVPQAAIDRVEVVRGGASDLYGADALAGVVQVLTARPDGPALQAEADVASHATPRASLFAGHGGERWHASLAGEASQTDGVFVVAEEDRGAIDTRAGSDYLTGRVSSGYGSNAGWFARGRAEAYGESRENGTPLQVNSTELAHGRLDAGGPLAGGALEVYAQAGDQVYRQAFSAIGPGRASETLTTRQRVPASQYAVGVTWRTLAGRADLLTGAETREIVATNQETGYFPDGRVRAQTDTRGFQRSSGLFLQLRTPVGSRTTVVAGARADFWEPTRGLADADVVLSPRVSVATRLGAGFAARGGLTHSFRAPTLNERYRGFRVGNTQTLANEALDPESLLMGELGGSWQGRRGSVLLTAFAGDLDEAITNVTISTTPQLTLRRRENAGSVHARGIEAEGEYRISGAVTATGAVALTRSRFVDTPALSGNAVPQVPRWQAAGGMRWALSAALALQGQVRAFGEQFEDDRNTLVLRSAAIVDVSATYRVGARASLFGSVENLFDVDYDTGRTPARTVGMPLTARAGVRVSLD